MAGKWRLTWLMMSMLLIGCYPANPEERLSLQVPQTTGVPKPQASQQSTPALKIVNQRMKAYNSHNLEEFLKLYSDDIEIFTYPDRSLGKGKKHLKKLFQPMFEEGKVNVKIHGQFAKDSYVVNHETVDYGNSKATEYVSVYEVRDGLITSVRFIRD